MPLPVDVLLIFFGAAALLALAPGPDNLFVLTQSLAYGARAGLLVVLGLCSGLVFHTAVVALGLAALLRASPNALLLIKLLGAGYLLYLAWMSWRHARDTSQARQALLLSSPQLYRRGVIMNATNPKVALFFLAFLPQFVDPQQGPVTPQILLLGLTFALATILVFGGIALLAGRYAEKLNASPERRAWLNRAITLVFLFLAVNLLAGWW